MTKQTAGLTSAMKKLGGVIASVFAVRALINFGKEAIELGSNIAEVQNVVDTAFGDMAYKVEAFADTAIESFGMSQLAAKKTASTYMAMAKGMGLAEEEASNMAISLAGLTGDVASFYNISQELADVKLKAVFTGETEGLKDLGVVMTQANLQAYALEKGITKDMAAMTQAELVGLRYSYVMDKLALANGDFAKTADGWANQTRVLEMQWQEFMSIIGDSLIVILTPLLRILNQIVSALIRAAQAINSFVTNMFGGAEKDIENTEKQAAQAAAAIGGSTENQDELTEAVKKTAKEQKKAIAGFDEINKLTAASASGGGSGGGAAGGLGADLTGLNTTASADISVNDGGAFSEMKDSLEKLLKLFDPLIKAGERAFKKIRDSFMRLAAVFEKVGEDLVSLGPALEKWFFSDGMGFMVAWVDAVGTIASGLVDDFAMVFEDIWNIVIFPQLTKWTEEGLPMVTQFGTEFVKTMEDTFVAVDEIFDRLWNEAAVPVLTLFQNIWDGLFDGLVEGWENHGAPVFSAIRKAVDGTKETLLNIWSKALKPVFDKIIDVLTRLWDEHLQPLWVHIGDFAGELAQAALDIYNGFILPVYNWLVNTFGPIWAWVRTFAIEQIGQLVGIVADKARNIIDALKGIVNFIAGVFTGDWERAWGGIETAFKSTINGCIELVEDFVNFFINGINEIISGLNSLQIDVPDGVPFFGGTKFGFNISTIPAFTLPRLAQGAVIPPNREFLAVLGDQKSGTNIETPLSTMIEAFRTALREMGYGGNGQNEAYLMLDDEILGKIIYRLYNKENGRVGVRLSET